VVIASSPRTRHSEVIDYLQFYVPLKNFSLGMETSPLPVKGCKTGLRAFEQGGIFIVPHLLWHGTSVFPVSSEGPPH
jgi:hypothetical protein